MSSDRESGIGLLVALAIAIWMMVFLLSNSNRDMEAVLPGYPGGVEAKAELLKIEDEFGTTTDLGWKSVIPNSFRYNEMAGLYQARIAMLDDSEGHQFDLRSVWVHPHVLDGPSTKSSSQLKLWQTRKDLKMRIVSRFNRGDPFGGYSYFATEAK